MNNQFYFIWFLALTLSLVPALGQGRKTVLSGYVKDAASGEPLTGAVVFTEDRTVGVAADRTGYYSLSVKEGEVTVLCSFTGYVTVSKKLTLSGPARLDFAMEVDRQTLEAATVFSKSKRDELRIPQMVTVHRLSTPMDLLPAQA